MLNIKRIETASALDQLPSKWETKRWSPGGMAAKKCVESTMFLFSRLMGSNGATIDQLRRQGALVLPMMLS